MKYVFHRAQERENKSEKAERRKKKVKDHLQFYFIYSSNP